jgi:hypothetical protein
MLQNNIQKYSMWLGLSVLIIDHPHLMAISFLIYSILNSLSEEEETMLRDVYTKGIQWLQELHAMSRNKGLTMREGRELISNIVDPLFKNLNKEYLQELTSNELLQDKVSKFIIDSVNSSQVAEEPVEWFNEPLSEYDDLNVVFSEYKEFIEWCAPSFDWDAPYTNKAHRQLFKSMKAVFRNSDASIKNEIANKTVIQLERWVYDCVTGTFSGSLDDSVYEFLINRTYKENELIVNK